MIFKQFVNAWKNEGATVSSRREGMEDVLIITMPDGRTFEGYPDSEYCSEGEEEWAVIDIYDYYRP
jgi:hypothetical protein